MICSIVFFRIGILFLACLISFAVSGCSSLSRLPDGRLSTLKADDLGLRGKLSIIPVPLPVNLQYRPVKSCKFRRTINVPGKRLSVAEIDVLVRSIENRVQVMVTEDGGAVSIALMRPTGALYDFNVADPFEGGDWVSENYQQLSANRVETLNSKSGSLYNVINPISILFPEYKQGHIAVGDTVSTVNTHDGQVWASYVYSGMAHYDGQRVAILDLVGKVALRPSASVVYGFNLLDVSNSLPIVSVIDAGNRYSHYRTSCM